MKLKSTHNSESELSRAQKKMKAFLVYLLSHEGFLDKVLKIRGTYGIPTKGFQLHSPLMYATKEELYNPEGEWKMPIFGLYDDPTQSRIWNNEQFKKDIDKLCKHFDVYQYNLQNSVALFVMYNQVFAGKNHGDLCELVEEGNIKKYHNSLSGKGVPYGRFPILIRISPYASERDIIDFLRRNIDTIKELQEKNKKGHVNIGKVRLRANEKRDTLIHSLRKEKKMSYQKIADRINETRKERSLTAPEIERIVKKEEARRSK